MADIPLTWLQKHERIIICVFVLAALLVITNAYFNYASKSADARNQAAQQTLAAQKEANDKLAAQTQQAAAQYQVLLGQLNAQNQKLTAEMLQLSQTLAARQKQDAGLSTTELAARHESLIGTTGVQYSENGYLLSPPAELQTVQELESLPVLKTELADETSLADNKSKALDSCQSLVVDLGKQVVGLQTQAVDSDKAHKTELAAVKADARKSKKNWFVRGVAVGGAVVAYVLFHI